MQACGLKHPQLGCIEIARIVTPHAGVWIETQGRKQQAKRQIVTPHAGVWIETPTIPIKKRKY